jgi:hypothetical protein
MKKLILAVFCLFAGVCSGQSAQPITNPYQHFVDISGNPCSGCTLWTYAAGTTTQQATYTTAAAGSVNQNPIVLDAAGGANIWIGASSYKFALFDTYGTLIWTVDNVLAPSPGGTSTAYLPLTGGTMSGNIFLSGNSLLGVGNIALGTTTPNWRIDVENGQINSLGYLYNGAAPLAHYLCGNATYYVDCTTFPYASLSGIPATYYQTLYEAGAIQPQEPATQFGAEFAMADNPGIATNIDLKTLGTGGSCTFCSLTYDIYGRVTVATSGGTPGGITQIGTGTGCSFPNDGNGLTCSTTVTLPSAMPDTAYTATCAPQFSPSIATTTSAMPSLGLGWSVTSTTSITIYEALNNGSSTGYGISHAYGITVYCTAHHT